MIEDERKVLLNHAARNAGIVLLTLTGQEFLSLVNGSVIIENIFNLPGLGRYAYNMIIQREYSLVSGTNLIFGSFAFCFSTTL
jgi:ABC-type dipeptide/oligopeptide/nickel transport system permease component